MSIFEPWHYTASSGHIEEGTEAFKACRDLSDSLLML